MGWQKEIVVQIVLGGGDCVITVKDNQPTLKAAIESFFQEHLERDLEDVRYRVHETRDKAHGRIDERTYYLTKPPRGFDPDKAWPQVKAIGYAMRWTQQPDGRPSGTVRILCAWRTFSCGRFTYFT